MPQDLEPGDFLVFQLEAGFALLRLLAVDDGENDTVWHLAAYSDLFPDVETAEVRADAHQLEISNPHLAITNRAFESTQVARIANKALTEAELAPLADWRKGLDQHVSDRSVRLLLGLR